MFIFVDTYQQAKSYVAKARNISPVDYCEEKPKNKNRILSDHEQQVTSIKENIKIKCERLTSLKRAIRFLNQKNDKHKIENLDPMDVDEFDDLLSDREDDPKTDAITSASVQTKKKKNSNDADVNPSHVSSSPIHPMDDDIIVIGSNRTAQIITTGIVATETDPEFSLEYGFTKDVSEN